jgi:hypothetical protein
MLRVGGAYQIVERAIDTFECQREASKALSGRGEWQAKLAWWGRASLEHAVPSPQSTLHRCTQHTQHRV